MPITLTRTVADLTGPSAPAIITVEEAGAILGMKRSAAYEAARAGEIPTLRLGRRVIVPVPKLLGLLGIEVNYEGCGCHA